ncbi:hypothetical protein ACI78T_17275 [Blastococcus sp. SYSU D00922]
MIDRFATRTPDGAAPYRSADVASELQALRDEVSSRVSALAQRGALDAGNGDVLDAWLERQRTAWHARLSAERTTTVAAVRGSMSDLESRALEADLAAKAADAEVQETERAVGRVTDGLFDDRGATSGQRERRRRPRPTSDPLEGLAISPWSRIVSYVLLGLAAVGDVVTFYAVLATTFRESGEIVVIGLTAAFAAASVGLMHSVGRALKNLREAQGGLGRPTIVMLVLGWLTLGAVAVFFRLRVSTPTTASESIFDDASGAAAAAQEQLLSAVLLGGLFLASGLLAFYVGYSEYHPKATSYRLLRKRLVAQQELQVAAATAATRARHELDFARDVEARADQRRTDGMEQVDATVDELKELVRVLVAEHMGVPEATNGLTTGRLAKDHPAVPPAVGDLPSPRSGDEGAVHDTVPKPKPVSLAGAADLPVKEHAALNGHAPSSDATEWRP